jgi:hypothetical protein
VRWKAQNNRGFSAASIEGIDIEVINLCGAVANRAQQEVGEPLEIILAEKQSGSVRILTGDGSSTRFTLTSNAERLRVLDRSQFDGCK